MRQKGRSKPFALNDELRFTFYLAKELGMTVAQLLDTISAKEFELWKVYLSVEAKLEEDARKKAAKRTGGR